MIGRIKELAEQAGIKFSKDWGECYTGNVQLERFAELVRQDERNLQRTKKEWSDHDRAIAAAEREACLAIVETHPTVREMSIAIRARSKHD